MSGAKHGERAGALRRYTPYPAYKDSGVEWLGEIPAHWEVKKWRYCCHVTEGQVAPDDDRFRERILIAPNHIESGTGRILYTESADEQGAISGKYLVAPGDIIYSKIRPALNKVCIATGDWLCSADMYPIGITEKRLHPRFLLYFMLSEPFVRLMTDESMRVAMPKVNREKLATSPLIIADPEEQRAIAAFLDRETARIDALVAKKERLIALLQEQRTALITRAVTKGLDPTVPMKDSGVEWLGEIPAHWEIVRLKDVVTGIEQGWSPLCENRQADESEWGVLKVGCVNGEDFDETEHKALPAELQPVPDYEIRSGDILMSRANTRELLGSAALVRGVRARLLLCDKLYRIRVSNGRVLPEFVVRAVASGVARFQLEREATGASASMQNISQETISNLLLPLPPTSEQRAIATFLGRETARIDALVEKVREAIGRLKELRTALISAAVTGKIDVREEVA